MVGHQITGITIIFNYREIETYWASYWGFCTVWLHVLVVLLKVDKEVYPRMSRARFLLAVVPWAPKKQTNTSAMRRLSVTTVRMGVALECTVGDGSESLCLNTKTLLSENKLKY